MCQSGYSNVLRPGHHYQKFKFHQQQEALAAHFDFTSFLAQSIFRFLAATFFILGMFWLGSSISGILQNLQWKTIKAQHKELRILMLYKIIHRFVELSLPNYIISAPCCTRRNSTKFIQPMTSIDSYKFSFFPYSITQWNKLPDHVVNTTSLNNFKSLLKLHL